VTGIIGGLNPTAGFRDHHDAIRGRITRSDLHAEDPAGATFAISVQVAGLLAATGVTAQVRSTTPVNPYDGVTVTVPESPVAAPATKLSAPLLVSAIAGGGGAVTVAVTFVVELSLPVAASLPVTATV